MNSPFKVIWKFKNDNRYVQYHIYIFIGKINSHLDSILKKIENLNFFDTLVGLDKNELRDITAIYGTHWYNYFFNSYHVAFMISQIQNNKTMTNDIEQKMGHEWYNEHIIQYDTPTSNMVYTYSGQIRDENIRKMLKKTKGVSHVDDDNANYKLTKDVLARQNKQAGGNDDYEEEYVDTETYDDNTDIDINYDDIHVSDSDDEIIDDIEPDPNVDVTSDLIDKAIGKMEIVEQTIPFDQSKDSSVVIDNLKQVYTKYYIRSQYIHEDDTIKAIKDKICCSLHNNAKFGDFSYLFPSRQYLWCEYTHNRKLEKVMLGQKWLKSNDILDIDIEPDTRFYIFEELRDKLKNLRYMFSRYGNKIKYEDDDSNILSDYDGYLTNNEIYLLDVYNELGKNYAPSAEVLKNLHDVYFKLYFHKMKQDDIKNLLENLNGNSKKDKNKYDTLLKTIHNDLLLENEIMQIVEEIRPTNEYQHIFKANHVTQTTIHVNINFEYGDIKKLDLYRIFNNFRPSELYPYVQYQAPDSGIVYKYDEKELNKFVQSKENMEMLQKWFENAPYGLSFKLKLENSIDKKKFMTIGMTETGRIEYKMMWQEAEEASINDIAPTYIYIKDLLSKINEETPKLHLRIPTDNEFKYAFINTIQKFELPDKFTINHNDLSDFSRYFFPYVALVIEPKKRQAKVQSTEKKSKYGTYLRYKRVSKYENGMKIEQKIRYFMKNYEFQDSQLAYEIAKQFNITDEKAAEHISKARAKYPDLKKARKVLKKLDNMTPYKPPGIDINIQGKQSDKYKIRISGAKSRNQLNRITTFMNILLHLYIETYLYKKKERQILKEKLKTLTNIAKRRAKVEEIVNHKEIKPVKKMTKIDVRRLGFKPEKGHNQWTRLCQNSGTTKRRHPQQYNTHDELTKAGYSFNKKTNNYEKKIKKGKKEIILRTIKLPIYDQQGEKINDIHYACDPVSNGEHMHVGFLTRSTNPYGHCMPCCFKKDPIESNNKAKLEFYKQCLGKEEEMTSQQLTKSAGDKLYILQDTNKIQEGRFGYLPKYLDKYFNQMLNKNKKTRHHYLEESSTGYFFKYGTPQESLPFVNAVAFTLNLTSDEVKQKAINALKGDTNNQIFTSLNNGDICSQFGTREQYIEFIQLSYQLNIDHIGDLLSLPGILTTNGLNIISFMKKEFKIRKTLEKEQIIDDFFLSRTDPENLHSIIDPKYASIFILNDNKNFYPIVLVKKEKASKNIHVGAVFTFKNESDNIVRHISDFYSKNCLASFISCNNRFVTAKSVAFAMQSYDKIYHIAGQVIDTRNKCKYLVTEGGLLLPVIPSGCIWNIKIIKNIEQYTKNFYDTYKNMMSIYKMSNKTIKIKPSGVYYNQPHDNESKSIIVTAIITKAKSSLPVIPTEIPIKEIEDLHLLYENKQLYDKIDAEIIKGPSNYIVDDRITRVKNDQYFDEGYEIFRFELSNYLQNEPSLKTQLEKIINSSAKRAEKTDNVRLFLYKLIDRTLHDNYAALINQTGGAKSTHPFVHVADHSPSVEKYTVNNDRTACNTNINENDCNAAFFCNWNKDTCSFALTPDLIIIYVNKVSDELVQNNLKAFEIMQKGNYFVSDIVDRTKFTEYPNQKIIRATSNNVKRILTDLLGKDNVPIIGKRRRTFQQDVDYDKLNLEHPPIDLQNILIQRIISTNISIFRAYANGFYWIINKYYDDETRNIGYYNPLQTDMANNFRGKVIELLNVGTDHKTLQEVVRVIGHNKPYGDVIKRFLHAIIKYYPSTYMGELIILSKINKIPIILLNDNNEIESVFHDGVHMLAKNSNLKDKYDLKSCINIKFEYALNNNIPIAIDVVYAKSS